ncbi:protein translocase subunit SecD [Muribaculaceae bacterium Isolate-039 (Harlan)]|jgi:SecD/SecF fusion protein|uniref:Multifunctional fusion protein n=16 Tax=Duncaniella muris TaxID=2094150 RepID=A0A2V1ISK7_9BACT|nr:MULTISPECIES: protein translocase subunit SecD [Duncaniella]NBH91333.1 protein translocase subunit SecD [Muribaculaceae bacterium S4]NBI19657.1 protein translocase subunit SecD [Muribaculaceae bacterium Z1]ROS90120.1 protein translocase subunit SecD [Muribaculaceae bacterium Isolate-039 (Harlan)]ROS99446.1 protein translocase subunit SecD [Muribaculaceae bacterium Isolate-077 (Janvier)]ROS99754.1 protein translocase subunit SecD [Muribaculaceae bacterium Isolate-083 (Janvier)]ROT02004.1 pr
MQSKGSLGSVVAGVIAIFMVLICLFYLSFTLVTNHYEKKAEEYAAVEAAKDNNSPETKRKAYSEYIKNIANEKVYLGYTFNEVQKLGVGLGLDLKGGMNVTLQVSVPDILRSMANAEGNPYFERAVMSADSITRANKSNDFIDVFCAEYRKLDPQGDLSVVFKDQVKRGDSMDAIKNSLRQEVKDRVSSSTNVLRTRIDQFGVVAPNIQELEKDGQILLELPGVKEHDRVRELLKSSANLEFYETTQFNEIAPMLQALDNALRTDTTGNGKGLFDYFLQVGNPYRPISVGSATETARDTIDAILASNVAKGILPSNLKLAWEFKPEIVQVDDSVRGKRNLSIYQLVALKTSNGKPALSGDVITSATSDYEAMNGNYVSMNMKPEAARQWARITAANLNKPVAIVLDNQVYSSPNVNSVIEGGRSQITGNFTTDEAKDLANVLKSGKMAAKVDIISDTVIGPSLGEQAIHDGLWSFIIAIVLLMIFMCLFYGLVPGIIANIALIFNIFFTFGILASFQAVLTLSGIAGIVLALGMAVDANVLIYERAKEELRAGKSVRTAIADGYSNAFSAIFDSNLTSIITGVILLLFGTGPIKGFATTLIIGIVCSFFTAVYLTRLIYIMCAKTKPFEKLTFTTPLSAKMFSDTHFNFLGARKVSFGIVGAVVAIVIISFFARGLNQGIDFSGGRNYVVQFDHPVKTHELQAQLAPLFDGAQLSVITIDDDTKVRISTNYKIDSDEEGIDNEITGILYKGLENQLNGMSIEDFSTTNENIGIMSSQKVGPTVANDMRTDAYIAVILALLAMFFYILLRFRNIAFSLGALAAVAFTAFTIIGFYSLFWGLFPFAMEIDQSFIAAILTVIGYQINDTVVVFDRVRENVQLYPKQNFFDTINSSMNSTLGRTVMTSCSTLLVLLCIFILGGDAIRSFVFAMIFGVIIGTLATIYVAAPVAYLTDARRNAKKAAKA